MKKYINGHLIPINLDFWTNYVYGKESQKYIVSNMYVDNLDQESKQIQKLILNYKKVYNSLNFIIQTVETDEKYYTIAKLLKLKDYYINKKLYVPINKCILCFQGQNWAIIKKVPNNIKEEKDIISDTNYYIYYNYMTSPKNFLKNSFKDLYEACDEDEDKLQIELEDILNFLDVEQYQFTEPCIVDLEKGIKYQITIYSENSLNSNNLIVDIENNKIDNVKCSKKCLIEKQLLLEDGTYTKPVIVENSILNNISHLFNDTIKGFIINSNIFYQIDSYIYLYDGQTNKKLIQNGNLYGVYKGYPLISYQKDVGDLKKHIIYLYKNNQLDICKIYFTKD